MGATAGIKETRSQICWEKPSSAHDSDPLNKEEKALDTGWTPHTVTAPESPLAPLRPSSFFQH